MNYKILESIKSAIVSCKLNGSSEKIKLYDNYNTIISAEWEEWEVDSGYDVVTIYVYQNDIIEFRFQIEETKVINHG